MGIPAIDPSEVGTSGLAWLLISYGYMLYYASNLISEGSDLLLLVPSLAGLVGSVVLPLLGAIPDGAIMLFSGLGEVEEAQEKLAVGVGALAGSTIMLLTVPWALSVYYGRVDFSGPDLEPNYKGNPKVTEGISGKATGVDLSPEINHGARMMMLTTLPYFIIQGPAFFMTGDRAQMSEKEHWWSLAGFVFCFAFFVYYLFSQVKMSNDSAHKLKRMAIIKESLKKGKMSLSGALGDQITYVEKKNEVQKRSLGLLRNSASESQFEPDAEVMELLKDILSEAFRGYDQDDNGTLSKKEFQLFLTDFHENIEADQVDDVFGQFDRDRSGTIDYNEFIRACYIIIKQSNEGSQVVQVMTTPTAPSRRGISREESSRMTMGEVADTILDDDDDESSVEEEEVPEDLTQLSPDEQQKAIKKRAFTMLFIGTALVLIFSDPMVDAMSEVAVRTGIPAFYVAFILAPLASNASEVIASQYYAAKKTRKTITVALTALEGAASMNNTFCLSIFMALIYFRGLAWQYSAETISIVAVQFIMGMWAQRDKMSTYQAYHVLALFPLSILAVAIMEHLGMD